MAKKISRTIPWFILAGLLVGVNAVAAVDIDREVNGALGAILFTNIALVASIIFQAGTSLQRLKQLEAWKSQHEQWATNTVRELREESTDSNRGLDGRLREYQRADVIEERLRGIDSRLKGIEQKLHVGT